MFGEDLRLLQNGFVSVTELLDAMSDTFELEAAESEAGQPWIASIKRDRGPYPTGMRIRSATPQQQQPLAVFM